MGHRKPAKAAAGRTLDPPTGAGPLSTSVLPCGSGHAIGLSGSEPRGDGHHALL